MMYHCNLFFLAFVIFSGTWAMILHILWICFSRAGKFRKWWLDRFANKHIFHENVWWIVSFSSVIHGINILSIFYIFKIFFVGSPKILGFSSPPCVSIGVFFALNRTRIHLDLRQSKTLNKKCLQLLFDYKI